MFSVLHPLIWSAMLWLQIDSKLINKQHLPYCDCVNTVQMLGQFDWFGLFFLTPQSQQSNVISAENLKEVSQQENQKDFLLLYASSCLNSCHNLLCFPYISSVSFFYIRGQQNMAPWAKSSPLPIFLWSTS